MITLEPEHLGHSPTLAEGRASRLETFARGFLSNFADQPWKKMSLASLGTGFLLMNWAIWSAGHDAIDPMADVKAGVIMFALGWAFAILFYMFRRIGRSEERL